MPTLVAVNVAPTKTASERRVTEPVHDAVADGEGHHHAHQGDERGLQTRPQQIVEVGLQTHLEEQDQDAEFGQGVKRLRLVNEPEDAGPDDHAGQQFAEDGRLADPLHPLAGQLRGEPDEDEAEQQRRETPCCSSRRPAAIDMSDAHLVFTSATERAILDVLDERAERRRVDAASGASRVSRLSAVCALLAVQVAREDPVGAEAHELRHLDRQPSALEAALVVIHDDLLAAVERDLCSTRLPWDR